MSGKLYICPTPIGNLEDMTYRTVRILNEVDLIAAEDTRHSIKLLNHFEISKPLTSYHEHNKDSKGGYLINKLLDGENIALISDAGMPGISDPGAIVVRYFKERGLPYTVIPGASALINAFVLSGYDAPFTFVGFLPDKKKETKGILDNLKDSPYPQIFYVSPHSIHEFFDTVNNVYGDREVCVVRELTKKFEEVNFTTLDTGYQGVVKGEFVCIVKGKNAEEKKWTEKEIVALVEEYIQQGLSKKDAIAKVCTDSGLKKNYVYNITLKNN